MALFYRVHPWLPSAALGAKGNPFFVPSNQGGGRIDNPAEYKAFYVSDTATGAIAEAFGDNAIWTPDLLSGLPALPGSVTAVSTFEGTLSLLDLDEPTELARISVRPSRVVTRHRRITQAWALALFLGGVADHGVAWWSYHEPEWTAIGLWDFSALQLRETVPLTESHPGFIQARHLLARPWQT